MKENRILWMLKTVLICMSLGALFSGVLAEDEIKAPLLTGKTWHDIHNRRIMWIGQGKPTMAGRFRFV